MIIDDKMLRAVISVLVDRLGGIVEIDDYELRYAADTLSSYQDVARCCLVLQSRGGTVRRPKPEAAPRATGALAQRGRFEKL